MPRLTRFSIPFAFCLLVGISTAGDWHQWRGPNRNGISPESVGWTAGKPRELWRVPLGKGFSGISIVKGRGYTMCSIGGDELTVCFDINTGKQIWRQRTDRAFPDTQGGDGPRSTPTVSGDAVYVLTAYGKVHAHSIADGKILWTKDLQAEFGGRVPNWGYSGSVLVEGDVAYAEAGGSQNKAFVAFNKKTGAILWTSHTDKAAYSSPMFYTIAGTPQVVFFSVAGLAGVAPDTGKVLWNYKWPNAIEVNAASPVLVGTDKLFVSSGYDTGAAFVQIEKGGWGFKAKELWTSRAMKSRMATPVFHDGYLYGFDAATLVCLDPTTGDVKWKKRGFGEGSLMLANGDLVILGDTGELAIAAADPSGYREKVSAKVLDGDHLWTVPTLANGRLYLRSHSELVCLEVRG